MTIEQIKNNLLLALDLCGDGGYSPFTLEQEDELRNFVNNLKDYKIIIDFFRHKSKECEMHAESLIDGQKSIYKGKSEAYNNCADILERYNVLIEYS